MRGRRRDGARAAAARSGPTGADTMKPGRARNTQRPAPSPSSLGWKADPRRAGHPGPMIGAVTLRIRLPGLPGGMPSRLPSRPPDRVSGSRSGKERTCWTTPARSGADGSGVRAAPTAACLSRAAAPRRETSARVTSRPGPGSSPPSSRQASQELGLHQPAATPPTLLRDRPAPSPSRPS